MAEVWDWSTTAANNNQNPPDGWPENMKYSEVNNSARESQAAWARQVEDMSGVHRSAGGAGSWSVSITRIFTGGILVPFFRFAFQAHADSNGVAMTLALTDGTPFGFSPLPLVGPDGNEPIFYEDGIYEVCYDDASNRYIVVSAMQPYYAAATVGFFISDVAIVPTNAGEIRTINANSITLTVGASALGGPGRSMRWLNPDQRPFNVLNTSGFDMFTNFTNFIPNGQLYANPSGSAGEEAFTLTQLNGGQFMLTNF